MAHAGLRGAIAVALAVQLEGPFRETVVATTMVTVLFTVFVLGGSTKSLLDYLQVDVNVDDSAESPSRIESIFIDPEVSAAKSRRAFALQESVSVGPGSVDNDMEKVPSPSPSRTVVQARVVQSHSRVVGLARWLGLPSTASAYSIV